MKPKTTTLLVVASILCSVAEPLKELPPSTSNSPKTISLFEFSGANDEPGWTAVNDGVMGGVSRGGARFIDGHLHFRGILSLENNGGFSSIRSGGPTRDLSAAQAIVLRVKGDGRSYRLQLATSDRYRRARVSYQAEFPTQTGTWVEVNVPLATLVPTFRGQTLSGPKLDLTRIEEIGLSLSDGNPGAFALEVDWIKAQ